MTVAEPDPGRVLTESGTGSSLVTTTTVSSQGGASLVQISATWDGEGRIGGLFVRMFAPKVMRVIYADDAGGMAKRRRQISEAPDVAEGNRRADEQSATFRPRGGICASHAAMPRGHRDCYRIVHRCVQRRPNMQCSG